MTERWIVRCRVSGGVTGTRESVLNANGVIEYFDSREAAQAKADHLRCEMNHRYSVAQFQYWPEPAEELWQ